MTEQSGNIKKILCIITQSEYGGAQRFFHVLLQNLDPNRYAVTVASGVSGKKDFLKTQTIRHLVRNPNMYHDLMAVFEIRRLIKELAPDMVFLLSSKAGFIGSLAARLMPRGECPRVIYRIGGWSFNDPGSWLKKITWLFLEWLSARWKDIIIVNNRHDFDQARKYHIKPRESVQLIYNGIDAYKSTFLSREEARKRLLAQLQIPNFQFPKTIIGTIANFYATKGLTYLIEAAALCKKKFPDASFIIIGDGMERTLLERLIRERDLADYVVLAGQIPDAAQLLPAFDIFVMSSLKEGFPWVLLEAMAAKVPVIATRVGANPEIIEHGKNGFIIEPTDSHELANRIMELAANDRLQKEFAIQGHQTVLFKFSIDRMLSEIFSVIG